MNDTPSINAASVVSSKLDPRRVQLPYTVKVGNVALRIHAYKKRKGKKSYVCYRFRWRDGNPLNNGVGIRLAITQANGTEHEQVIHFAADEENQLRELQAQFEALLTKETHETSTNSTKASPGREDGSRNNVGRKTLEMGEPVCMVGTGRIRWRNRDVSRLHHAAAPVGRSGEARIARQKIGMQVPAQSAVPRRCLARTRQRSTMNRGIAWGFVANIHRNYGRKIGFVPERGTNLPTGMGQSSHFCDSVLDTRNTQPQSSRQQAGVQPVSHPTPCLLFGHLNTFLARPTAGQSHPKASLKPP